MKKLSNQEMKKIAKSTLALVLAGTFTFSPVAMAEENHSDLETVEMQNVSPEEIEEAKSQVEELEEINPTLIPGDFFYFAKIALEKIKLAFTFDQAEEAELLAAYASERLAEAGALFAEGKEEEALKVIEAAVQYMETTQDIVDQETSNDAEEDLASEAGTVSEEDGEDKEAEESAEEEVEPADDADAVEQTDEDTDEATDEEEVVENEDDDAVSEDPFEEIEGMLRQNIIALKAAMEHVGNENARAQLQKNIDKTYAKMAKKLAKIEEKYGEKPAEEDQNDQVEPIELEPVVEPDLLPADETPETEDDVVKVEETMPADDDTAVAAPVKAQKEKAKQERKAEKAAVKQERKEAKQQVKEEKRQAKQVKKEEKHQAKQGKKEEKKTHNKAQHGNGHGKGNDKN
ncbi:hypothetical protein J7E38_04880 [Bacillus sp. ISL-35]|uniref:DUF5667 domain-containing protein n=1 Tax=Bacillus sp. ISL-35 TaxID=2819122 RepID=UPI001BEBE11F|nr:DUF5667 domain-containing protein [Bacillus sp. ISL-35]MBT2678323.1 hypothetical protein [Bacillus sp. ISL-35]MBT2705953.1 hypothetical protein [Chryseobacterium sp. ISL-80]